ncbi:hypothetical protein ATK23_1349 [Glutamicibacter mysorens]|uniref:DUF6318 domain-containing protein n=1 Tax=Glutamicibacter mysorens TaxID=257984 RepID=A0ABX4MXP3_9MICC|nr:DUF6318 family protein [Glutamicibacter mysorens]PJJ44128.1 hypothetical protein ATK23_1349 [Glutamicibacter mysorens]
MDTRKIAVVASVAAVALALSGCSTGSAEGQGNSPSAVSKMSPAPDSTTKNPSPSKNNTYRPASPEGPAENVPVPKLPALAKEYSEDGAASFSKFYFDLVNYAIETNNAGPIKKVTTKECIVCGVSIIDEATEAKKLGKWHVGGKHHPQILDSYISGENLAVVTVEYTADKAEIYLVPNEPDSKMDKLEPTTVAVGLEFDHGWKVYRIIGAE